MWEGDRAFWNNQGKRFPWRWESRMFGVLSETVMGTSLEGEGFSLCFILTGHQGRHLFPVSHVVTRDGGWNCIWSLSLGLSGKVNLLRNCREPVEVGQGGQGWLEQWGTWWSSADLIAPFRFLMSCGWDAVWLFMEVLRGRMGICDAKFGKTHCFLVSRRRHFWMRRWISWAGPQGDLGVQIMSKPSLGKAPTACSNVKISSAGSRGWTWDLQRSLPSYCFVILS